MYCKVPIRNLVFVLMFIYGKFPPAAVHYVRYLWTEPQSKNSTFFNQGTSDLVKANSLPNFQTPQYSTQ